MYQLLTMNRKTFLSREMIFNLGLGFDFMTKNGKLLIFFVIFFKISSYNKSTTKPDIKIETPFPPNRPQQHVYKFSKS